MTALAAVIALAVPVASGATEGIPALGFAASAEQTSDTQSAEVITRDTSSIVESPSNPTPTPTGVTEPNVIEAEETSAPAPSATGSRDSSSTAGTSSASAAADTRPAAAAPDRPLSAQPAPLTSSSPSPTPTATTPSCPAPISGTVPSAPNRTSSGGVAGTTTDDLQAFANAYNAIRVANCLPPIPYSNIRYDSCMEDRLFWMAEDPSTDPMSAWGHIGSQRSDGVPSVGCDGNLAGGSNNTGATVAQKWWDSSGHRTSLYKPSYTGSTSNVCVLFSMTHGGIPNEPLSFTRAAARWTTCG